MPDYQIVQTSPGKWASYDPQQPWLILDSAGEKPPTNEQVGKALKQAAAATGTPARSTARIGPVTPEFVTVGDFIDDPKQAASRVLDMVKQQIKDPKNIPAALGLAIGAFRGLQGAFGPELEYAAGGWEPKPPSGPSGGAPPSGGGGIPMPPIGGWPAGSAPEGAGPSGPIPATPTPAPAAPPATAGPTVGQVLMQEAKDWALEKIPGGRLTRGAARVYQAVQRAKARAQAQATAPGSAAASSPTPPQAPAETAAAPTPVPAAAGSAPPTPAPTVSAPATAPASAPVAATVRPSAADLSQSSPEMAPTRPAAAAAATPTAPAAGRPTSSADIHLTPAETATALKWHEQGVSPETILERIFKSRELTARTKATTPEEAAAAIKQRNATGKWPGE